LSLIRNSTSPAMVQLPVYVFPRVFLLIVFSASLPEVIDECDSSHGKTKYSNYHKCGYESELIALTIEKYIRL